MQDRRIRIDSEKCNGCGACVDACHEGAIALVEGKAALVRVSHCDGLGDCLPVCPTGAISFEEKGEKTSRHAPRVHGGGSPGSAPRKQIPRFAGRFRGGEESGGALMQWPCQIALVPPCAPYLENADLLIAADCAAYTCASFHERFMRERITLIGCPKLDGDAHAAKLKRILSGNAVRSVTVVRMEVPCCGGMERAVRDALQPGGGHVPLRVVTLTTDGKILSENG